MKLRDISHHRLILSLIPPLLALGLQTWLWEDLKPHTWLLFYPAIFFSGWLGGPRGGVAATLLSLGLVAGFFSASDPALHGTAQLPALAVFALMGLLFAGFHGHYQAQAREKGLSERRFRTMFEEAPLGIALTDSRTREIHEVNRRFAEIVGRARDELKGIDWKDITAPEDTRKDMDNTRSSSF
jgi:PAS domain-containing protein